MRCAGRCIGSPANDEINFKENLLENYWSFDSLCVKSIENIQTNQTYYNGKIFKSCLDADWSTFYPDPKSDLTSISAC